MSEKIKLYRFDTDFSGTIVETRRKIAWPVTVWSCIVPEDIDINIDILQELLLSMVKIGIYDYSILTDKLQLPKDLLKAVLDKCEREGYLKKDKTLSPKGESLISEDSIYDKDYLAAYTSKKILVIQDRVSTDIIPLFSLNELPSSDWDDVDVLIKKHYNKNKPIMQDITYAIKLWCKNRIKYRQNVSPPPEQNQENDEVYDSGEFDEFKDGYDWDMQKKENDLPVSEKSEEVDINPFNIKIWDDEPIFEYFEVYFAVNIDNPENWSVISPFGANTNEWFTKRLRREMRQNQNLNEEITLYLDDTRDKLRDRYPFNNIEEVQLFYKIPLIANDPKFNGLKKQLEGLERNKNRIINNHEEDYDGFYAKVGKILEILLKLCIDYRKRSSIIQEVASFDNYERVLLQIEKDYNIFGILDKYANKGVFKNFINPGSKNPKELSVTLLLDAYYNKDSQSMLLLKNMPEIYNLIFELSHVRNQNSHDSNKKLGQSEHDVVMAYNNLNNIISVIYAHYLRGES